MNMIIAVARPGYDVLEEAQRDPVLPNRFIFHSDYNTFKIIKQAVAEPTLAAGDDAYTMAHGLSYVPFVFGFCAFAGGRTGLPGTQDPSGSDFWFTRLEVDATNVRFHYHNGTGGNYTPKFAYFACESPVPIT